MKKISALLILLFCFIFASCNYETTPQLRRGQYEVNYETNSLYLVKVNKTNSTISGMNSGCVEDYRMLTVQENDSALASNFQINDNPVYKQYVQSEYFRKLNKDVYDNLLISDARAQTNGITKQEQSNDATVGQKKNFFLATDDNSFVEKEAVCKAFNEVCNVWYVSSSLDSNSNNDFIDGYLTTTTFNNIAAKVKTFIKAEEELCGSHIYTSTRWSNVIDPKDKIDVIIYDIFFDAKQGMDGGTYGYHYSGDLIQQVYDKNGKKTKYTNETQCIYVDSYFLSQDPLEVYSTLVHEYNHLLNYITKTIVYGKECSVWFTEMLSMVTEDLMHNILGISSIQTPQGRFPYFIMCANYGFKKWLSGNSILGPNGDDVLISYANAYIYGAYIGRNFGGPELIHRIATNEYVNEEAITEALKSLNIQQVIDYDEENNPIMQDVTFSTTLEDEYIIMFNTSARDITNNQWQVYYTLNNKEPLKWSKNQNIKFDGFSIEGFSIQDDNGTTTTVIRASDFYNKSAKSKSNARPLYPYGFDINLIKTERTSYCVLDVCLNNSINYFLHN